MIIRLSCLRAKAFQVIAVGVTLLATAAELSAAPGLWERQDQPATANRPAGSEWIRPQKYRAFHLDHAVLRPLLDRAPREFTPAAQTAPAEIELPMPDGSLEKFRFVEAPVMAPELAAKFPEIRTFRGQGIDDPAASVRFDFTPAGFHAQILSPRGAVYVDPLYRNDATLHATYYKRDYRRAADGWQCLTPAEPAVAAVAALPLDLARSGSNLRTYRLACAADGEYTAFHGGTVLAGLSAVVTAINRVTGVCETELAIRLVLVANNDLIIYTNPSTDPYNNTSGSTMLNQNQTTLDSVIGSANYDIGHVFSTGGGGIAGLGVVCITGSKARGVTGNGNPVGDSFWIDYVVHEMGHQFGANHTFNSSTSNCGGGNRNASTAYEQGSGSTIMAYAGICGSDDLQPHSDPYFHFASFDEILAYTTTGSGSGCPVSSATGNTAPGVSAGANYSIPANTPFTLTASGSDPDGDPLTYCWEERDLGASTTVTAADNGSSPLFRSWNPTASPSRTFPRLADLLNNTLAIGEIMPTTTRTMNFRVTARDNRAGGGGVNTADMQVSVTAAAGPFTVTSHNSGGMFSNFTTVTWNVAGTTAAPVNAANVNILLSTNGGQAFPIVLLANTPNDGSEAVLLPNLNTSSARLKVEAAGNIFFDVNNANFTIAPGVPTPLVVLDAAALASESCGPANNVLDPGETVAVNFALKNTGSANTTNLIATLLATNGVMSPSGPQSYGALVAGGAAASLPFTFNAAGDCGSTVTATLQLQDGGANLGTVSKTFVLGTSVSVTSAFTNAAPITIPASGTKGAATPYPSAISVTGVTGTVAKVTVTLAGLSHTYPDDLDVLLVGPGGQTVMLMSDVGGSTGIVGVTLTFDDSASGSLPDSGAIASGTCKPTNIDTTTDNFPFPAPAGPFGSTLAMFNGLNPNGTWSLYILDDDSRDTGSLAQGWRLSITTSSSACCSGVLPTADLALNQAISPIAVNVTSNLTITLAVTNLGPDMASAVTVDDALPAGLTFITASASQGTWTNNGGIVSVALGLLTNGGAATVTIEAVAATSGHWTNTAVLSAATADPVSTNNSAAVVVVINAPPVLTFIPNLMVHAGSLVMFTNLASDPDLPPNTLTFSLGSNAVATASLDSTTGVFTWPTSEADADTTNIFTVTVADDGVPPLTDTQAFSVAVSPRPFIQSIEMLTNAVRVNWTSIAGQRYYLQQTDALPSGNWTNVSAEIYAAGPTASAEDTSPVADQRFYRVLVLP